MIRLLTQIGYLVVLVLFTATCIAYGGANADAKPDEKPEAETGATQSQRPTVQIAILLDNSGSMSGLIDQARSELWTVVNEFADANLGGVRPELQVAVYHYGNPPATQLVSLTNDLDRVSEALFGIPVSGGSEYCGAVIQAATNELEWSTTGGDLKMIFIAGNEPFSQGHVDYRTACQAAANKGIVVNTIHCGRGIPEDWLDGAKLADGKAMSIDHTKSVVHIEAPQDEQIARLGVELNKTYIAYGPRGQDGIGRQNDQDNNAKEESLGSAQQRAVTKANGLYRNSAWDLCDALEEGKVDLSRIKSEDLPENMRKMTLEERCAYVEKNQQERGTIKKKINELNIARIKFVSEKQEQIANQNDTETLDKALIAAIREQATKKDYTFDE